MTPNNPSLAELLFAACWLEATARKPGNVHPEASFSDLSYFDFVRSARAAAPVLARSRDTGVGRTIHDTVVATRQVTSTNSNLGMILLLAPLAAVPPTTSLSAGIAEVLEKLTVEDATWAYRAIRLARPGGMGEVSEQDVSAEPTITLRQAMALAADRDLVASQYVSNFSLVLNEGLSWLLNFTDVDKQPETAVVQLQLQLLAANPDSLIVRKCGAEVAAEASERARHVLSSGWPHTAVAELSSFDTWLRSDGHRRNPGTTADLVAAILFSAFREKRLLLPEESHTQFLNAE